MKVEIKTYYTGHFRPLEPGTMPVLMLRAKVSLKACTYKCTIMIVLRTLVVRICDTKNKSWWPFILELSSGTPMRNLPRASLQTLISRHSKTSAPNAFQGRPTTALGRPPPSRAIR